MKLAIAIMAEMCHIIHRKYIFIRYNRKYQKRVGTGMKKISKKNSRGFTLIEMVLVIAIIVILAAVLALNIGTYLGRAKNAASSVAEHNKSISDLTSVIDGKVSDYYAGF